MPWTPWIAALAPVALIYAAAGPRRTRVVDVGEWAARAALVVGLLTLALALAHGPFTGPLLGAFGLGLSVRVDVLSGVLASLIGLIGVVVVGYSRNYLAGDPRQAGFVRHLCLTLAFVQGLVLSGNLFGLALCWIGMSFGLNRLLLFRAERQAAVLAARKRFLAARLSDTCLILAGGVMFAEAGTGDIATVLAAAEAGPAWAAAAVLLALAAVLSSAQLPLHGWILEVMETPTPVSALLHAGVVNAGGFLILRFADVVAGAPGAMLLLVAVGGLTALFGSVVMLTQPTVKSALAYSTIAQMGFMLLECGLGAFSAALLHIVAHAAYKAHAFLSAGDSVRRGQAVGAQSAPGLATAVVVTGAVLAGSVLATAVGRGPAADPGAYVLTAVVVLSMVRLGLEGRTSPLGTLLAAGVALSAYAAARALFGALLDPVMPAVAAPGGVHVALAILLVAAMTALTLLQGRLAGAAGEPRWARAYALVVNGFYLNTLANRWVLRFWPTSQDRPVSPGAAA